MQPPRVLISGAGIAGLTLAFWLERAGMRVTIVERAVRQRSSGSPVDVRGRAAAIAERMGILAHLRERATNVSGIRFVDASGRVAARVDTAAQQRASGSRDVEIARSDLAAILQSACADDAELLFEDAIRSIAQDGDGVDVTFERAAPRRFDLVVGADGLHSAVRRLVFGIEQRFVRHAGLYVATLPLAKVFDEIGRDITMYNAPGRSATIHPARDTPLAAFIFWKDALPGFDHRDLASQRRLLEQTYGDDGWHVPALLDEMRASSDFYFDSVSRVRIPTWSAGRVVLVGDAASCVSLLGDGSTLAMIGGYSLATTLAECDGAFAHAFRVYEAQHRRLVEPRQRLMQLAASLLVPRTGVGIRLRNAALRMAPLLDAARAATRRVQKPDRTMIGSPPRSKNGPLPGSEVSTSR
jgi:2-polyprenyl-6-methoxyphenol hydroxylase-like FAD-dependent oxidoreductase